MPFKCLLVLHVRLFTPIGTGAIPSLKAAAVPKWDCAALVKRVLGASSFRMPTVITSNGNPRNSVCFSVQCCIVIYGSLARRDAVAVPIMMIILRPVRVFSVLCV